MVEKLLAALGTAVALCALIVSWRAHLHQVRRAEALELRELRVEERERRVEARDRAADRQQELTQASMLEVRVVMRASPLQEGWATPELRIFNPSNQPVRNLRLRHAEGTWAELDGDLGPGAVRTVPLPAAAVPWTPYAGTPNADVWLDFTDVAGTRWRKDADGGLREGSRNADGEWEWGPRESPAVGQHFFAQQQPTPGWGPGAPQSPPGMAAGASRRRIHFGPVRLRRDRGSGPVLAALALGSLAALALLATLLLWWLR